MQRRVFIEEIANKLPVDKWFSRAEFAKITGISCKSASIRLLRLRKAGFLKIKGGKNTEVWKMTAKMKKLMLIQSEVNLKVRIKIGKKRHANNPKKVGTRITNVIKAEVEAYKESAERSLKAVKFI